VLFTQREDFTGVAVPFCQGHLHAGTLSQFRAVTWTVPPNNPICLAVGLSEPDCTPAQIGGSARGYQRLPAPFEVPATATQTAARPYFYASTALA